MQRVLLVAPLAALDALFLCHSWSLHARALRPITQNIDQFFEMQCELLLQGLLDRERAESPVKRRPTRG